MGITVDQLEKVSNRPRCGTRERDCERRARALQTVRSVERYARAPDPNRKKVETPILHALVPKSFGFQPFKQRVLNFSAGNQLPLFYVQVDVLDLIIQSSINLF